MFAVEIGNGARYGEVVQFPKRVRIYSAASAAILSAILTVTTANKAPGHPDRSHVAQLSKHEPNKHPGNSRVARATSKDKSTSVVADAGRLPLEKK